MLLGRAGEEPGRWTGTTGVVRAGRPLLHTTADPGRGAPAWSPPMTPRGYASTVQLGQAAGVLTADDAVRLPLPGGWVAPAWGDRLHHVTATLARLGPGPGEEAA
ncbi:hypothetical protein ACI8AC_20720 [Geodermatophilus sp. SYSU D00758]